MAALLLASCVTARPHHDTNKCGPKLPCTHTVVAGDNLHAIAEHYSLHLDDLVKLNEQFADPNLIHPGDVVNLPCKPGATSGTSVADLLANRPDMSILLKAATAAGFAETLSDPNLVATVFAPSNCYFKALIAQLDTTAEALLADTELLKQVLSYHVVAGVAAKAADLTNGQELPTLLEGQDLQVLLQRSRVFIETTSGQAAKVIKADLPAGKAVVHIVNEVLIPAADDDKAEAPAPSEPSNPTDKCTYTVKAGDFLWKIAESYKTTVEALLKLNPAVTDPNLIYPGDVIKVPC